MEQPAAAPIATHEFLCSVCGETAGNIEFLGAAWIARSSFTPPLKVAVGPSDCERISSAIVRGDAAALYEYDFELTPFYCPQCCACFCGKHWRQWGAYSIRGECPAGHVRLLDDGEPAF